MRAVAWWLGIVLGLTAGMVEGEVTAWQLGGSGLEWGQQDTVQVMIDFDSSPGAIRPVYLTKEQDVFSRLENWAPYKTPRELGFVDGSRPRIWVGADGFFLYQRSGLLVDLYVDGDSTTYVTASGAIGTDAEWYTIDIGVPVPADQFGFYPPPRGFTSDGRPLSEDVYDAFEVSISEETDPHLAVEKLNTDYQPLERMIAKREQNFEVDVNIDFPKQYVRFVRFKRLDTGRTKDAAGVKYGTIGDFELWAEGIPKRVFYISKIIDLGREVNFGRIFWKASSMRMVDGTAVEAPDAEASIRVELRGGRNDDPNIYHEFTDSGEEVEVTREHFEKDLKPPDINGSSVLQEGKPGLRASVKYDTENWSYWSYPLASSGSETPLERARYLQLEIFLDSQSFEDFIQLDSLWLETSPLLAQRVAGEVARLDNPAPINGLVHVELGQPTEFLLDIESEFTSTLQNGFDAIQISTGSPSRFIRLERRDSFEVIEPEQVEDGDDGVTIYLPERITRTNNLPLRVVFETRVFVFANTFGAQVFDSTSEDLPQRIEAGDVTEELSTNSLKVWGDAEQVVEVIRDLELSSSVVTPNGDGINDQLRLDYLLFRLPGQVPVDLNIYRLDGTRVVRIGQGEQGAGPQQVSWDGRDQDGRILPPGMYLLEVDLRTESEARTNRLVPIGVAY